MGCGSSTAALPSDQIGVEYFKVHSRAEPLRAMLNHKGCEYTEQPVSLPGWMNKKISGKDNNEFGLFLPVVSFKGKRIGQFNATLRAIGIEHGYYDPSDWKQAIKIDWIVDTWAGCLNKSAPILLPSTKGKDTKDKMWDEVLEKQWTPLLKHCEKQLESTGSTWLAGDKITIADCCMVMLFFFWFENQRFKAAHKLAPYWANLPCPKLKEYSARLKTEFASHINNSTMYEI